MPQSPLHPCMHPQGLTLEGSLQHLLLKGRLVLHRLLAAAAGGPPRRCRAGLGVPSALAAAAGSAWAAGGAAAGSGAVAAGGACSVGGGAAAGACSVPAQGQHPGGRLQRGEQRVCKETSGLWQAAGPGRHKRRRAGDGRGPKAQRLPAASESTTCVASGESEVAENATAGGASVAAATCVEGHVVGRRGRLAAPASGEMHAV